MDNVLENALVVVKNVPRKNFIKVAVRFPRFAAVRRDAEGVGDALDRWVPDGVVLDQVAEEGLGGLEEALLVMGRAEWSGATSFESQI